MLKHSSANRNATSMCLYACIPLKYYIYDKDKQKILDLIKIFDGVYNGQITERQIGDGPGFSSVFKPDGYDMTYAEMGIEKSHSCSIHAKAITKLSVYLNEWVQTLAQ